MSRGRTGSGTFDLSEIGRHPIRPRTTHTFTVHHSSTSRWVATINVGDRHVEGVLVHPARHSCLSFTFDTEQEAKRFARAYAPPRMLKIDAREVYPCCFICNSRFQLKSVGSAKRYSYSNCRNCGVAVCRSCCVAWSQWMIPKTFMMNDGGSQPTKGSSVRACKSCDWLSNAFCIALLKGRLEDAQALQASGNVNLRSSYPNVRGEAMFPVHCAATGGNAEVLRWLVDTHGCPICVERSSSLHQSQHHYDYVMTSKGRSVLDLALTGKHIDVLRYLVMEKDMRVQDAKNPKQALEALDAMLRQPHGGLAQQIGISPEMVDMPPPVDETPAKIEPDDISSTVEDACTLCYEKTVDCVLLPCGHQMCCADCGHHLDKCPVCKVQCSVLRVFRN